jgi:peptidoglycan/LPS O-acetylase OafA/YrhL
VAIDGSESLVARRNASFDNLRVLLTLLVIFHHVAIAYGGSGGWYWR